MLSINKSFYIFLYNVSIMDFQLLPDISPEVRRRVLAGVYKYSPSHPAVKYIYPVPPKDDPRSEANVLAALEWYYRHRDGFPEFVYELGATVCSDLLLLLRDYYVMRWGSDPVEFWLERDFRGWCVVIKEKGAAEHRKGLTGLVCGADYRIKRWRHGVRVLTKAQQFDLRALGEALTELEVVQICFTTSSKTSELLCYRKV